MSRFNLSMLGFVLLLTGCASAPKVASCPQIPPLVLDVPGRNWQGQMESFLRGTLPMPPDYSLPSTNAKLNTMQPEKR